jgi:hypothetical protein
MTMRGITIPTVPQLVQRITALALFCFGFVQWGMAQYEVVLVKEHVTLNGQALTVGQKIRQEDLDRLDFKGANAMIAVYNPSQGRLVRPEKDEVMASASVSGGIIKRNQELDQLADNMKKYFKSYVFLTDNPTIKFDVPSLGVRDDGSLYDKQFNSSVVVARHINPNNSADTLESEIVKCGLLSDNPEITLSKSKMHQIAGNNDFMKIPVYVRIADTKDKANLSPVRTMYISYLSNTDEFKKEVRIIKNANEAQGKNEIEIFNAVYQYMDKYYGTPLPSDLGTWLNTNFGMKLNVDQLTAPTGN